MRLPKTLLDAVKVLESLAWYVLPYSQTSICPRYPYSLAILIGFGSGQLCVVAGRGRSPYSPWLMQRGAAEAPFPHRHLLGIEGLSPDDINQFLDLADGYVELNRQADKKRSLLRGRTIINCFFESSTRTRTSFEVAGKRLGGDVIIMSVPTRASNFSRIISKFLKDFK